MKRIILMTMVVSACALTAFSLPVNKNASVRLDQVRTDGVKTYPTSTVQGRTWFVENVH